MPIIQNSELRRASAFENLAAWRIDIAIEVPAVKEWDCSGAKAAERTARLIDAVYHSKATVKYLAMDEPLVSGLRVGYTLHSL